MILYFPVGTQLLTKDKIVQAVAGSSLSRIVAPVVYFSALIDFDSMENRVM